MKKITIALLLALAAFVPTTVEAGTPISQSELPAAAMKFIKKYYPKVTIRKAEKDNDYRGVEYEVDLNNGAELEFNADGEWRDIKAAYGEAVPADLVPEGIAKYVAANYADLVIVELQRRRGGYEVELSNGAELHLTAEGAPMTGRRGGGRQGGGRR